MQKGNKRIVELAIRFYELSHRERAELSSLKEQGFGL
jgi:hypothetical protein